nr:dihydrodipicolinate synthase family protein [Agromyces protaetiae]
MPKSLIAGVPLEGIVPPVLTPFTPSGEVDTASLAALAEHLIGAGVNGLFACGSSAEIALLDDAQREQIIGTLVDTAAGRVPVVAGAIDSGTRRTIAHAKRAADLGVAAVVVTAPYYVDTHDDEVLAHFRTVASALDVPVIAYDIPSTVHRSLPADITIALAREGAVIGIKDSSGNVINFRRVLVETEDLDFSVLMGNEPLVETALFLGAHGAVPSLANVEPAGFVGMYRAAQHGDWSTVKREQTRLNRLRDITTIPDLARIGGFAALVGSMKSVLVDEGVISSSVGAAPFLPLTDEERAQVGSAASRLMAVAVDA